MFILSSVFDVTDVFILSPVFDMTDCVSTYSSTEYLYQQLLRRSQLSDFRSFLLVFLLVGNMWIPRVTFTITVPASPHSQQHSFVRNVIFMQKNKMAPQP